MASRRWISTGASSATALPYLRAQLSHGLTAHARSASRVKQRIKTVLEWAAAGDLYPGYNHGMWVEADKVLNKRRAEGETNHHLAAPYTEVASIIQRVRDSASQDIVKLTFEFTVLTAARSGETRGAKWSEVKWDDRLLVIPGGLHEG